MMEKTVTQVKPTGFSGLPYSPVLLLDARFDASITDCSWFRDACSDGFEHYFEEVYEADESGDVVVDRVYTWREVEREIVEHVTRRYDAAERFYGVPCLPFRAGFMLGWLSALAFG